MRPGHAIVAGLLVVLGIAAAGPLPAQTLLRSGPEPADQTSSLRLAAGGAVASLAPDVQERTGTKSPLLAGALSYVLPGIGSYYAGNSGHGTRHLLIAGGSTGLMFAGMILWVDEVVDECFEGDCRSSNGAATGMVAVGMVAYLINNVWAIATAVGDATAYNREHSGAVASASLVAGVHVEPTLDLSHAAGFTAGAGPGAEPRFGLRLVRRF